MNVVKLLTILLNLVEKTNIITGYYLKSSINMLIVHHSNLDDDMVLKYSSKWKMSESAICFHHRSKGLCTEVQSFCICSSFCNHSFSHKRSARGNILIFVLTLSNRTCVRRTGYVRMHVKKNYAKRSLFLIILLVDRKVFFFNQLQWNLCFSSDNL